MKVLFIALAYIDSAQDRGIYPDLLRKFVSNGHQVYAVTALERRRRKRTHLSSEGVFSILKVWTPNLVKINIWEKGLGILFIETLFAFAISKFLKKIQFDLIIYGTPPITLDKLILKLKRKHQAKTYLLLKDIFPQNAVDLGMLKREGLLYKFFRKKEIDLYKVSDYIGCMSENNRQYLLSENNYLGTEKVEINPNSIELEPEGLHSHEELNFNVPNNKVKIIYGGNLGKPQSIPSLINAIKYCSAFSNVFFIIVGSGTEEKLIEQWIKKDNPTNILYIHSLPYAKYCKLISLCDIGLIFLNERFTIPNYPSRLLNYLQLKKPVICATDQISDVGTEAEMYGYGRFCATNDIISFGQIVQELSLNKNLRTQMGINGYKRFCSDFEVSNSYQIIMNHFNDKYAASE